MRLARIAAVLLAVPCLLATPRVAQAQQAAPGVQFVAALQDALSALPAEDVAATDSALDRVRAPLQLARDVAGDGTDIDPILADLARDPADVHGARARLERLVAALQLPPGSVAEDPSAARHTLDDVYRQDQFANLGRRSSSDLFGRIGSALLTAVRWLADHLVGGIGEVPALIIAGLVLAAIVAFVVHRLHRAGVRPPTWGRVAPEPGGSSLDPDEEWRLAGEAAARGDHRQAVRHAFRSALLAIAVRGRLHVDAAWTTSELLARARGDADLVAALAPAADSFDRAWYSGRPVSQQDWVVARERCEAVRRLASRRGVAA